MQQMSTHQCQQCGNTLAIEQRFCPNCGTNVETGNATITHSTKERYISKTLSPSEISLRERDAPEVPAGTQTSPPAYVPPGKERPRGLFKQAGRGIGIILLLVLLVFGVAGYFGWTWVNSLNKHTPTTFTTTHSNVTNGNAANGAAPADVSVTTTLINSTVTYAGVDITVASVQQASTFDDDRNATNSGATHVVRVNVKETNTTPRSAYVDSQPRLILPDGTIVAPVTVKKIGGPAPGVRQANWWDFPVDSALNVDQLTLRIGSDSEVQMEIPLRAGADLSKYQPKTATPNVQAQYGGMVWKVTSTTLSWSDHDAARQAPKGMRYLTVMLKVDNPTAQDFRGVCSDYIRLQIGDVTSEPDSASVYENCPITFAAESHNVSATVVFLVPENSTSFTLILMSRPTNNPPLNQAEASFQIS